MVDMDKEIAEFLTAKLIEKVTKLTSYYFVELSEDEEAKKTLEANDFFMNLLEGKGFSKKDSTFIEKHEELFREIHTYSKKIKSLSTTPKEV